MSIEEYDIVKVSGAKCCECGDDKDLVMEEDDYICTDCLFEKRCMEREAERGPELPWYFQ